jgi:hypothetical protein
MGEGRGHFARGMLPGAHSVDETVGYVLLILAHHGEAQNESISQHLQENVRMNRAAAREFFALLLKERDPLSSQSFLLFARNVERRIIDETRENYLLMRDKWQKLERMAVGVSHEQISKRVDAESTRYFGRLWIKQ